MDKREKHASEQQKENSQTNWEIDIKELITNNTRRPLSRPCCIYKANLLRYVDSAAFTPKIVSIGPLHHFDQHLMSMEETKVKYLEHFLRHAAKTERLNNEQSELNSLEKKLEFLGWKVISDPIETEVNDFTCLGKFLSMLKSLENDIRSSYADNLNHIDSEEFLKIILLDSAFITELFLRFHFGSTGDPFLSRDYQLVRIRCDLWLMENQLPFFVLQQLYNSAFGSYIPDIYPPFLELTAKCFSMYNKQGKDIKNEIHHFTDLLRAFFLPTPSSEYSYSVPLLDHLPSATQLDAAGVKFSASENKCLLDVNFSHGKLVIPSLHLWMKQ